MEQKLKKLLEAVEHEVMRKPSRKTLDRLSLLAGFQDWDAFQKTFNGDDEAAGESGAKTGNGRMADLIDIAERGDGGEDEDPKE